MTEVNKENGALIQEVIRGGTDENSLDERLGESNANIKHLLFKFTGVQEEQEEYKRKMTDMLMTVLAGDLNSEAIKGHMIKFVSDSITADFNSAREHPKRQWEAFERAALHADKTKDKEAEKCARKLLKMMSATSTDRELRLKSTRALRDRMDAGKNHCSICFLPLTDMFFYTSGFCRLCWLCCNMTQCRRCKTAAPWSNDIHIIREMKASNHLVKTCPACSAKCCICDEATRLDEDEWYYEPKCVDCKEFDILEDYGPRFR